jgi:hypothetical protein
MKKCHTSRFQNKPLLRWSLLFYFRLSRYKRHGIDRQLIIQATYAWTVYLKDPLGNSDSSVKWFRVINE